MNILILSAGTRDKIVQYFKATLNGNGKVIATDMSNIAPAVSRGYDLSQYFVSFFYEAQVKHAVLSLGVYGRQTARGSRTDYTYIKFLYFRHKFTFKLSGP